MPYVLSCMEAKRNYEKVLNGLKERRNEIFELTNELGNIRKMQNDNWNEFKSICISVAKNICTAQRMDKELDSLFLQKKRLEEMVELAHVNQEAVAGLDSHEPFTKSVQKDLSLSEKLLKLHARSKSISRSNISQRTTNPLTKSDGTFKFPVMLTSVAKLKSMPSPISARGNGLSTSLFSSLLEKRQRATAASFEELQRSNYKTSGSDGNRKLTLDGLKLACRQDHSTSTVKGARETLSQKQPDQDQEAMDTDEVGI